MPVESPLRGKHDQRFGLIETLRYEPDAGVIRMHRHLDRMSNSAQHFARRFDRARAEKLLLSLAGDTAQRVRLYLDEHDDLSLTAFPFTPVPEGKVWHVAIASVAFIEPENALLAHKTSVRDIYDRARAEYPADEIDEVLLLNRRGHVCEGTITSLFVEKAGCLRTPPLADGLLRGVLRQELLDGGSAVEDAVLPEDLQHHDFFVGNSLRGLIRARLVKP